MVTEYRKLSNELTFENAFYCAEHDLRRERVQAHNNFVFQSALVQHLCIQMFAYVYAHVCVLGKYICIHMYTYMCMHIFFLFQSLLVQHMCIYM